MLQIHFLYCKIHPKKSHCASPILTFNQWWSVKTERSSKKSIAADSLQCNASPILDGDLFADRCKMVETNAT